MWLFTRLGFYSAVCGKTDKGAIDPDTMMIRARLRVHLERLVKAFPALLGDCEIHKSESRDYRFRMIVPKLVWVELATALADEVDYGNFKDQCHREWDKTPTGSSYTNSLHRVWGVMYDVQQRHTPRRQYKTLWEDLPKHTPFKGHKGTIRAKEDVLCVLDGSTVVLVIRNFNRVATDQGAYSACILGANVTIVPRPTFERMTWGEYQKTGQSAPVLDLVAVPV